MGKRLLFFYLKSEVLSFDCIFSRSQAVNRSTYISELLDLAPFLSDLGIMLALTQPRHYLLDIQEC